MSCDDKKYFKVPNKINFMPLPNISMFDLDVIYQTSDAELLYQVLFKVNEVAKSQNIIIENFKKVLDWATCQIEKFTKEQLKEWLEDGTLENLILSSLQILKAIDTTDSLKEQTNLVVGQTYKTLGKRGIDDGGGRFIQIQDAPDPSRYFYYLQNGLYGNIVSDEKIITPSQFEGVNDSELLQNCINWCVQNKRYNIAIDREYYITQTVNLDFNSETWYRLNFIGIGDKPVIKVAQGVTAFSTTQTGSYFGGCNFTNITFTGEVDDRNQVTSILFNMSKVLRVMISNCTIRYLDYAFNCAKDYIQTLYVINSTISHVNHVVNLAQGLTGYDICFISNAIEQNTNVFDLYGTCLRLTIFANNIEGNYGRVAYIRSAMGMCFDNNYFEINQENIDLTMFVGSGSFNNNFSYDNVSTRALLTLNPNFSTGGLDINGNGITGGILFTFKTTPVSTDTYNCQRNYYTAANIPPYRNAMWVTPQGFKRGATYYACVIFDGEGINSSSVPFAGSTARALRLVDITIANHGETDVEHFTLRPIAQNMGFFLTCNDGTDRAKLVNNSATLHFAID